MQSIYHMAYLLSPHGIKLSCTLNLCFTACVIPALLQASLLLFSRSVLSVIIGVFLKMNLAAPATSRCLYFCSLVRHISHEHFRTSTRCKVFFFFHKHSLFSNIFIKKSFSGFLNLQTILVFLCLLSSIHQLSAWLSGHFFCARYRKWKKPSAE